MSEQDFIDKCREYAGISDKEAAHGALDDLVTEFLRKRGFKECAEAYQSALGDCWYA